MCSWVSVIAKVNNQEASGIKMVGNCEGQGFGWDFYISDSQILMCIWVTGGFCEKVDSDSWSLGLDLRFFISISIPSDADSVGPQPTL